MDGGLPPLCDLVHIFWPFIFFVFSTRVYCRVLAALFIVAFAKLAASNEVGTGGVMSAKRRERDGLTTATAAHKT